MSNSYMIAVAILLLVRLPLACAQVDSPQGDGAHKADSVFDPAVAIDLPANYVLGPNDQFSLIVDQLQDSFAKQTFRIDREGDVTIPMIGRVHATGLTTSDFEEVLKSRFAVILKAPDIVVNVTEYASRPVSVMGAVNTAGIHQAVGRKSIFEMLSLSGGLRTDAGATVTITRNLKAGRIPLPDAVDSGDSSVATISLKDVMDGSPRNIVVLPGDTLFVPRSGVVYAVGSVVKPGGFMLNDRESVSALQVVSLAEGLVKTAGVDKAKIVRALPGTEKHEEVMVDLKQIMAGKSSDIQLRAGDILYVPESTGKVVRYKTIDAIIAAATGFAVFGSRF